jgi:hypothetical protein
MGHIYGGNDEHMAALGIYGADNVHVFDFLLVLPVCGLEICAC